MQHLVHNISELCRIQPGRAGRFSPASTGRDGVPVISLADDTVAGIRGPAELGRVRPRRGLERYHASAGDVVFRTRGDRATATALDARFRDPVVALLPFFVLRPDRIRVLPEYLAWAINQPAAQRQLAQEARGTGTQMILRRTLEQLRIALPPMNTQRRIAAAAATAEREFRLSVRAAEMRKRLASRLLRDVASNQGGRSMEAGVEVPPTEFGERRP